MLRDLTEWKLYQIHRAAWKKEQRNTSAVDQHLDLDNPGPAVPPRPPDQPLATSANPAGVTQNQQASPLHKG